MAAQKKLKKRDYVKKLNEKLKEIRKNKDNDSIEKIEQCKNAIDLFYSENDNIDNDCLLALHRYYTKDSVLTKDLMVGLFSGMIVSIIPVYPFIEQFESLYKMLSEKSSNGFAYIFLVIFISIFALALVFTLAVVVAVAIICFVRTWINGIETYINEYHVRVLENLIEERKQRYAETAASASDKTSQHS